MKERKTDMDFELAKSAYTQLCKNLQKRKEIGELKAKPQLDAIGQSLGLKFRMPENLQQRCDALLPFFEEISDIPIDIDVLRACEAKDSASVQNWAQQFAVLKNMKDAARICAFLKYKRQPYIESLREGYRRHQEITKADDLLRSALSEYQKEGNINRLLEKERFLKSKDFLEGIPLLDSEKQEIMKEITKQNLSIERPKLRRQIPKSTLDRYKQDIQPLIRKPLTQQDWDLLTQFILHPERERGIPKNLNEMRLYNIADSLKGLSLEEANINYLKTL